MCLKEFILTLTDSLAYIDVVPTTEELTVLFSEIDLDNDGWVSYKTYFEFLTLYFGSKSEVSLESRRDNEFQSVVRKHSSLNLSPEQRFARIIMREMKYLLDDYNPFQTYDEQLIRRFLKDLFKLTDDEIDYVMRNLFRYGVGSGGLFMEMEIAGIFLEILFAEIALRRMHKDKKFLRWKDRLISLPEFLQLVDSACYWMRNKPPQDLLIEIFGNLDTDKDGFITYEQYIMFIKNFLSKRRDNSIDWKRFIEQEPPKTKDEKLYEDIWSDLRVLYMHYVKGQYLQEDELELLVKEVLHETTQNELEYIFWNMFRYDPNNDKNIEFEEFAPFILIHAGEIALQRFHFQQVLGKNSLSNQEFKLVFREAYHFLRTLNKTDQLLNVIFGELDTNNDGFITYKEFMTWIVLNVSRTVR
jgi:Ca2+-binding EF-hand superfamily protein